MVAVFIMLWLVWFGPALGKQQSEFLAEDESTEEKAFQWPGILVDHVPNGMLVSGLTIDYEVWLTAFGTFSDHDCDNQHIQWRRHHAGGVTDIDAACEARRTDTINCPPGSLGHISFWYKNDNKVKDSQVHLDAYVVTPLCSTPNLGFFDAASQRCNCAPRHYGPSCQPCTCQNGVCQHGVHGDGHCIPGCSPGWFGLDCDQSLTAIRHCVPCVQTTVAA